MTQAKRYTAEEFAARAKKMEDFFPSGSEAAEMLHQASETEANVTGLVKQMEECIFLLDSIGPHNLQADDPFQFRIRGAVLRSHEALSKFRGDV